MKVKLMTISMARVAARILIETKSVLFRPEQPFIFTSGRASPVYVDCRKLIAFPRARAKLMDMGCDLIYEKAGFENIDVVAGGETAGIPFAAWIAERMNLPMAYIRKKPKGFGRNARIEGDMREGQRVLLVEDMTTDGGSKLSFIEGIRDAGAICNHCFVNFSYGIFPESIKKLNDEGVELHHLATWWDVLDCARAENYFTVKQIDQVESFLNEPAAWSKSHGGKEN